MTTTNPNVEPNPLHGLFDTRVGLLEAFDALLKQAQHQVSLADTDLTSFQLENTLRLDALTYFLRENPASKIRLVIWQTTPLEAKMPRLLRLLHSFGHRIEVRTPTSANAEHPACFCLGDTNFLVHRFHPASLNGKWVFEAGIEFNRLNSLFNEFWQEATPSLPPSNLGL